MRWFEAPASAYERFLKTGNISYLYTMDTFDVAIVTAYFVILGILSFYGFHRYLMVFLFNKYRKSVAVPKGRFEELPRVTVQIPSYNEMYVMERVIDAVCSLDYPADRLDIQVLDDSTDETQTIARDAVERWQGLGRDIHYIHRTQRTGFKAGALENGLRTAKGEFIAIFDADFVPGPDFLQKAIHYFADPKVGMVQGRWTHLNREYSFLTKIQAVFLDGDDGRSAGRRGAVVELRAASGTRALHPPQSRAAPRPPPDRRRLAPGRDHHLVHPRKRGERRQAAHQRAALPARRHDDAQHLTSSR